MEILLVVLLAIDVALFLASQLRYQGYPWADQICLAALGLCDSPYWLGGVALVLFAATVTVRKVR